MERAVREQDRRRDFPSSIRFDPHGLETNSRAANKIITNVHEMLALLCARGLRHRTDVMGNHLGRQEQMFPKIATDSPNTDYNCGKLLNGFKI